MTPNPDLGGVKAFTVASVIQAWRSRRPLWTPMLRHLLSRSHPCHLFCIAHPSHIISTSHPRLLLSRSCPPFITSIFPQRITRNAGGRRNGKMWGAQLRPNSYIPNSNPNSVPNFVLNSVPNFVPNSLPNSVLISISDSGREVTSHTVN